MRVPGCAWLGVGVDCGSSAAAVGAGATAGVCEVAGDLPLGKNTRWVLRIRRRQYGQWRNRRMSLSAHVLHAGKERVHSGERVRVCMQ